MINKLLFLQISISISILQIMKLYTNTLLTLTAIFATTLVFTSCDTGSDDSDIPALESGSQTPIGLLQGEQLEVDGFFSGVLENGSRYSFTFSGEGLGNMEFTSANGVTASVPNSGFIFTDFTSLTTLNPVAGGFATTTLEGLFTDSLADQYDAFIDSNSEEDLESLIDSVNENNNGFIVSFDDIDTVYVVNGFTFFQGSTLLVTRPLSFSGGSTDPDVSISATQNINQATVVTYTAP